MQITPLEYKYIATLHALDIHIDHISSHYLLDTLIETT